MVQLTRQLTSVAVWLPPKKQVQQHLKQKKKKTEKHQTLVKTPTHLRAVGGETAIITTREPTTLPTHSNMRITVKEQMCAPCFCVWCLLVCAFWNKKNLTRLDDWGLCAHQRCAFGKTVTAGAKGGGGKIVVTVNWKQKTKTPHLENLNTVLISCTFSQTTVLVASTVQQQLCSPHWWR